MGPGHQDDSSVSSVESDELDSRDVQWLRQARRSIYPFKPQWQAPEPMFPLACKSYVLEDVRRNVPDFRKGRSSVPSSPSLRSFADAASIQGRSTSYRRMRTSKMAKGGCSQGCTLLIGTRWTLRSHRRNEFVSQTLRIRK